VDEAVAQAPEAERGQVLWAAAIDVASALAYVHAAGLCHCDVTPKNVLITGSGDGVRAVLIDLGLSAVRGVIGEARGTLAYMAPEALAGVVDPRADLWGLGATLFHAAAGAPPFGGASRRAVRAILTTAPPRLDPARAPGWWIWWRGCWRGRAARPASALAVFDDWCRRRRRCRGRAGAASADGASCRWRRDDRRGCGAARGGGALAACHAGGGGSAAAVCGPVGAAAPGGTRCGVISSRPRPAARAGKR
jgi:serine/threonine protein kinase